MAKKKHILFLSEDTSNFLEEYTRKHPTFTTTSQSADYLLDQVRTQALYQAFGELITPALRMLLRQELDQALGRWFPFPAAEDGLADGGSDSRPLNAAGTPEGSRDG
ncbi:MAG: hypothetical protein M3281_04510 [Chloroflexota bacterium]|nr:hypothetical protein [Chloroflexota bacterium]